MAAPDEPLAASFEANRAHLLRVAYATLGSVSEAEDVVQDAWLRLQALGAPDQIRDLRAWLTTTVGRLALDALTSARVRREQYVGPWLPEPILTDLTDPDPDPADRITVEESITLALLIVLERLSPAERSAFLLHDVFGLTFAEAADVVGRSPQATRQLASRARRRIARGRPRFPPTRAQQLEAVAAFATACAEGDLEALIRILDPDVVWRTDGGGEVTSSRQIQRGAPKVARAMLALARRPPQRAETANVNGSPGLVLLDADGHLTVIALTVDTERVVAIDIMRNPDKLGSWAARWIAKQRVGHPRANRDDR
jgi:RNA polymerase sigma-70 factor (ECF subfamily)